MQNARAATLFIGSEKRTQKNVTDIRVMLQAVLLRQTLGLYIVVVVPYAPRPHGQHVASDREDRAPPIMKVIKIIITTRRIIISLLRLLYSINSRSTICCCSVPSPTCPGASGAIRVASRWRGGRGGVTVVSLLDCTLLMARPSEAGPGGAERFQRGGRVPLLTRGCPSRRASGLSSCRHSLEDALILVLFDRRVRFFPFHLLLSSEKHPEVRTVAAPQAP